MKNLHEIKQALAELEDDEGRLTPEAVVTAAAVAGSPLHDLFDWDDSSAAQKYRLDQARTLIRSVKVVYTIEERTVTSVAYVHDPAAEPGEQGYRSVTELRKDVEDARAALVNEVSTAGAHLRRARDLAVALSMEGYVDELISGVVELRKRVEGSQSIAA